MALQTDLMGVGMSSAEAAHVGYAPASYAGSAGVTAQTGATKIVSKLALLTVATSTATSFLLPASPATAIFVYCTNLFASVATAGVYTATGNLLNGVTNGSLTLTTGQSALFFTNSNGTAGAVNWYSIKSA